MVTIRQHYNEDVFQPSKDEVDFFFKEMGVSREHFYRFRGCVVAKNILTSGVTIRVEARNRGTESQLIVRRRMGKCPYFEYEQRGSGRGHVEYVFSVPESVRDVVRKIISRSG
jgi:hypothetical protein